MAPLPPGPRLPAVVQTAMLLRDPVRLFERSHRRYGPVFRLRLLGFPPEVFAAPLISLIHHDPHVSPEPEEFRPERFLAEGGNDPAAANRSWMPFGGGRRYCAGAQLALLETRAIIREVLRRLDLHAPDPAPEAQRVRHVTFVPARQTLVTARTRDTTRTAL